MSTRKGCALIIVIVIISLIACCIFISVNVSVNNRNIPEKSLFEERKQSFENLAELLLNESEGKKMCFYLSEDESDMLEMWHLSNQPKKAGKLYVGKKVIDDIKSFSNMPFNGATVENDHIIFQYTHEFIVYNEYQKLNKNQICDMIGLRKGITSVWHFEECWYYVRYRVL